MGNNMITSLKNKLKALTVDELSILDTRLVEYMSKFDYIGQCLDATGLSFIELKTIFANTNTYSTTRPPSKKVINYKKYSGCNNGTIYGTLCAVITDEQRNFIRSSGINPEFLSNSQMNALLIHASDRYKWEDRMSIPNKLNDDYASLKDLYKNKPYIEYWGMIDRHIIKTTF